MKNQFPFILIGVSVIIAGVTLGYFLYSTTPEPEPDPAPVVSAPSSPQPAPAPEPEPQPEPEPEPQPEPVIEAEASLEVDQGINQARIRPDGTAVIAGLAAPGSTVKLIRDGEVIGQATANGSGEWVIVPDALLAPGSHLLSIEIIAADGTSTIGSMALVVEMPDQLDETPLVALVPYTVEEAPAQVLQAPDSVTDTASSETASSETASSEAAASEIDPASDNAMPAVISPMVTIRTIQALDAGFLAVSGMAKGGSSVELEIAGRKASPVKPTADSMYSTGLKIDPEKRKLKLIVRLLDADSKAVASASIRLSRGAIERSLGDNALVVVQKGDALWRIAYQTYGMGIRYVDIYRQNTDKISNPDLIYPDQIFVVPNR